MKMPAAALAALALSLPTAPARAYQPWSEVPKSIPRAERERRKPKKKAAKASKRRNRP